MKKVLVDIYHLPQYNFFKNAIKKLGPEKVDLSCVNRGKLAAIIKHECPEFNLHILGDYRHNSGPVGMTARIILPRLRGLSRLMEKNDYSVVATAHYQANFVAKLKGIPNFSILDDPRAGVIQIVNYAADEFYLPPFEEDYKNVKKFNALKEWAYLSPTYFHPDPAVLQEYNLEPKNYFFVREVSTRTSNYLTQQKNIVLNLADKFPGDMQVVLSLENKENRDEYPSDWIILKEPVGDIHSLMYYSSMVISSGDSVAREGAMLGVPGVYLGNRDMPANRILIKERMLTQVHPEDFATFMSDWSSGKLTFEKQESFRSKLEKEWDDVTSLILELIDNLAEK